MKRGLPAKTERIEGAPIWVGERQLIPVVTVRSMLRREVIFGTKDANVRGGGLVWLHPRAVIVREPDGSETRIQIFDGYQTIVGGMVIGALLLPIVYLLTIGLVALWDNSQTGEQVIICPSLQAQLNQRP